MESKVRSLEQALGSLSELHGKLEEVVKRQREAIVGMETEELMRINGEGLEVLQGIRELEGRCGELCAEIADALRIPLRERHTVERIARELPQERKKKLLGLREQVMRKVKGLKREAELNFGLARIGLEHAESCLGIILGAGSKRVTYSPRDVGRGRAAAIFEATV